jgi:gamma-glutamyl hydrolase
VTLSQLDKLNGIFYCGGEAGGDYITFGKQIFEAVKQKNDEGQYFPIWGTCLGFEDLAMFVNTSTVLTKLTAEYDNPLLTFTDDPSTSRLFGPLGEDAHIYETYNMALNHHTWGISPDRFVEDKALGSFYKPLSTSIDDNGKLFVSSMEAYNYPFYGTQFHPEKPLATFH